jgi:hypothetical protein
MNAAMSSAKHKAYGETLLRRANPGNVQAGGETLD